MTTFACVSASSAPRRAGDCSGLIGATTPAVAPANNAIAASSPFGRMKATVSPGPTPSLRRRFARRVTWPSSSVQFSVASLSFGPDFSWKATALRSGWRPAVSCSCS